MESKGSQIHGCKHKEPDGQRDHTKDEAGHDGILSAPHFTAIDEIVDQHLLKKCDFELNISGVILVNCAGVISSTFKTTKCANVKKSFSGDFIYLSKPPSRGAI